VYRYSEIRRRDARFLSEGEDDDVRDDGNSGFRRNVLAVREIELHSVPRRFAGTAFRGRGFKFCVQRIEGFFVRKFFVSDFVEARDLFG